MVGLDRLQEEYLKAIAEGGESFQDAIQTSVEDQPDYYGNTGRIRFALLQLVEQGLVDREEQVSGSYVYSLSEQGEQLLQRL